MKGHKCLGLLLMMAGCAARTDLPQGIVVIPNQEPTPGYEYALPGPLRTAEPFKTAGPFRSHQEALQYACPVLMSLPNAIMTPRTSIISHGAYWDVRTWDDSTEYCAWLYQTPDGQYELSWIGTNEQQDRTQGRRKCDMPRRVIDSRFARDPALPPDKDLTYVFAVHSHPTASNLSDDDVAYIVEVGRELSQSFHGLGQFRLGIIAFFSQNNSEHPSCDGFFQYEFPLDHPESFTHKIQRWSLNASGHWEMREVARVHYQRRANTKPSIKIVEMP
jgi:proteasome lid subunit RPN8/RPN11